MAGGIAHDFNNLLMVIQGYADLLVSKLDNSTERREAEQIAIAARRAADLTGQLLALRSREKRDIQSFLPNDVLNTMIPTLHQLTGDDLSLVVDLQDTGYVLGDHAVLQDAIVNLVLNARDASAEGGTIYLRSGKHCVIDGDVLANTVGAGDYGYITVEDNGQGMDEATLDRIFEPFFSQTEGGTGLGLSMVYSFAKEAGGTVEVDSKIDEGSRFSIILPAGVAPSEEVECDNLGQPEQSILTHTVLLVEDKEQVQDVLKLALEDAGLKVLVASNGREALDVFQQRDNDIGVVVTDVVMPVMDGGTLARHLKEIDESLPIIFITGYAAGQLDHLGPWAANMPVLRKPFSTQELLREINNASTQARRAT
jgi:two-component system, cell cycle sensor histidine kinase and response regulator CckA